MVGRKFRIKMLFLRELLKCYNVPVDKKTRESGDRIMAISKYIKASMVALLFAGALAGCSDSEEKAATKEEKKQETVDKESKEKNEQRVVDKSEEVSRDEDIQKQLEEEKGVSQASLLVTDDESGYVIVDVFAEQDLQKEAAKTLSEKYAKLLQEKYKGHPIDVQVSQGDTLLAQTTLEAK
jgi:hypothetical protein